jgi:hypothetical protein
MYRRKFPQTDIFPYKEKDTKKPFLEESFMPTVARKRVFSAFGVKVYKGLSTDQGKYFIKFGEKRSRRARKLEALVNTFRQ